MRIFKILDTLFQLFMLVAMAFYYLDGRADTALFCIIILGVYQVICSLTHLFLKIQKTYWRLSYSFMGIAILFLMLFVKVNFFSEDNFISIMIVFAPCMGIYYFILTCVEAYKLFSKETTEDYIEV